MVFFKTTNPGEVRLINASAIEKVEYVNHGGMPMTFIQTMTGCSYAIDGDVTKTIFETLKKVDRDLRIIPLGEEK